MGSDNEDNHEQAEINNQISAERIDGTVGQFGSVYGDVHLNPPKSPEEAAFRARYIAKMQESWDTEEKKKAAEEKYAGINAGCGYIFLAVFAAFALFVIVNILIGFTSGPGPKPWPF
jgi:hypothetical protein